MKYVEASKFGGPAVLVHARLWFGFFCRNQSVSLLYWGKRGCYERLSAIVQLCLGLRSCWRRQGGWEGASRFLSIRLCGGDYPHGRRYASHLVIPAATAIPFPKQLDPALAAAVFVQGLTAYLLLDRAQVKKGDVVLIAAAAAGWKSRRATREIQRRDGYRPDIRIRNPFQLSS